MLSPMPSKHLNIASVSDTGMHMSPELCSVTNGVASHARQSPEY